MFVIPGDKIIGMLIIDHNVFSDRVAPRWRKHDVTASQYFYSGYIYLNFWSHN